MCVCVCVCVCVRACVYVCCVHVCMCVGWLVFSLMAPLAKDQYAWSSKDATLYVNIISAGNSVLSVMGFIVTKYIVQW